MKPYALVGALAAIFASASVSAQTPKELKTKSGTPVLVVNLLDARPDCSASPGPVPLPTLPEKPANGVVQMLVVPTDVAASGKCPARKIPSIALIYTPKKDFVGTDLLKIDVEVGNRTTSLTYQIKVDAKAEPL
ncbi:hypothetical protein JQ543_21285 [Bradyrhizobium diazoefficiens]|nr:hypothetical protein [Bradyrhizobium diazoefficiens]MBR0850292.1 hypothetical protein [Bradyrhizobium diazoefficiens]